MHSPFGVGSARMSLVRARAGGSRTVLACHTVVGTAKFSQRLDAVLPAVFVPRRRCEFPAGAGFPSE